MARRKRSPEEIIGKLREAEVLLAVHRHRGYANKTSVNQ
jgi:hypothetical protein